jgi:hypothetical protein
LKGKKMTERDFAYWLQGFFEVSGAKELTKEQVQMIKEHLDLLFIKSTGTGSSGFYSPMIMPIGGWSGYSGRSGVSEMSGRSGFSC